MRYDTLPPLPLAQTLTSAVEESRDVTDAAFSGDAGRQDLYGLGLERCLFSGCRLTGCDFTRTTLCDVRFEGCDLSGVRFDDAGLHRVTFSDCRVLGAHFNGALWDEVTVSGGTFDYVNLSHAEWRSCRLEAVFRDAALTWLTVKKTTVSGCDFTRADWSHSAIGGIVFTDAQIEGCLFSLDGLQNVTVSTAQAIQLARLLGLNVRN